MAREEIKARCYHCGPAQIRDQDADYRPHIKRQEITVPRGTVHLLLKIPTHKSWYNAETHEFLGHKKCKGKITQFKTQGIRVKNSLLQTDAAAIRVGATPTAGHYYAYVKGQQKGWLKKEDINCTLEKRFVTNLKDVYYILLTKV
jgi:hypothetical protein